MNITIMSSVHFNFIENSSTLIVGTKITKDHKFVINIHINMINSEGDYNFYTPFKFI